MIESLLTFLAVSLGGTEPHQCLYQLRDTYMPQTYANVTYQTYIYCLKIKLALCFAHVPELGT